MIIEIGLTLPDGALTDTVRDIEERIKDTLSLLAEYGLIDDYSMDVVAL